MKVIVDTGFLSSLAKIDHVELLPKFFNVDYVVVPEQVLEELKESKVFSQVLDSITTEEPTEKDK